MPLKRPTDSSRAKQRRQAACRTRRREAKPVRPAGSVTRFISHTDAVEALAGGLDGGWDAIRDRTAKLAADRREWGGYPLPVEGYKLVVEPNHPLYSTLHNSCLDAPEDSPEDDEEVVNHWISASRRCEVFITRGPDGRVRHEVFPFYAEAKAIGLAMATAAAGLQAWDPRAELTAQFRLRELLPAWQFKTYLLSGTFVEISPRSQVHYLLRKGRPTVAMREHGQWLQVLAALCLHPIGYYRGTFAGAMTPTDDVIAHLLLIRGDERKFWAKANQHPTTDVLAGV